MININSISSGGTPKIEKIQPTQFFTRPDTPPQNPRVRRAAREADRFLRALLQMTPVKIAEILLNSEDERRNYVDLLPLEIRQEVARKLVGVVNNADINHLAKFEDGEPDSVIFDVARTIINMNTNVHRTLRQRLIDAEIIDNSEPGKRLWIA